jgi:hypothetical protein
MILGDIETTDVSLSRGDARTEAHNWFWQP